MPDERTAIERVQATLSTLSPTTAARRRHRVRPALRLASLVGAQAKSVSSEAALNRSRAAALNCAKRGGRRIGPAGAHADDKAGYVGQLSNKREASISTNYVERVKQS